MTIDRYELRQPIIPLPTTALATTTTSTTSTTSFDANAIDHTAIMNSGDVPSHLKLFYMPKIVKDGNSYRICQFRYSEDKGSWTWMCLGQPLSYPDTTKVRPRLRIACPSVEQKFDFEEVLDFLCIYNTRENGTFYRAAIGDGSTGRGYGERGTASPSRKRKLLIS